MNTAIWAGLALLALCFAAGVLALHRRIAALQWRLGEAEQEAARGQKALRERQDQLQHQLDDLPLEQIQTIYDSEKAFQDGLNALMSFGQQNFAPDREKVPHGS